MISPTIIQITDVKKLPINVAEVKRYLGVFGAQEIVDDMISSLSSDVYSKARPIASYICVPIKIENNAVDFGFDMVQSKKLSKNLCGCREAFIFGATLGIDVDRLIEKYMKIEPSKGVVISCIASALIESFCDYVNAILASKCKSCPRFSPGYGDFNIEHQEGILKALDANKRLGISLTDSFMMKPSKSVTAIIGIKNTEI